MYLVDTSIWLNAFRTDAGSYKTRIKLEEHLNEYEVLLAEPIKFNILKPFHEPALHSELINGLEALPMLAMKENTWSIALQLAWDLRSDETEHMDDLLVAALALQNRVPLVSFQQIHHEAAKIRKLQIISW